MIEKLAKSMVSWQMKRNYLCEKDINLYTYAYELFIGQAVNILIACLLAIVFNAGLTVLVFLLSFFPLRSYAGGHHADSYNTCTVISSLIVCAVCIASKVIPPEAVLTVNIATELISGGLIFKLAPMEDRNKPLNVSEKRQYRKYSILIWGVEIIFWIVSYYAGAKNISLAISLGHLSLSVLLFAGIVKNRYLSNVH